MIYKNNPFNIRYTGHSWKGLSGHKNGFCEFVSLDYGIRAWLILMRTYRRKHSICTLSQIINRFAPPSENSTSSYIMNVSWLTGIPPHKYLNFNYKYYAIGSSMAKIESNTGLLLSDIKSVAEKFNISIVS